MSFTQTCSAQCSPLDRLDYGHLLWTTLAEFPGIMITIAMIERLGRRRTMALEFVLVACGLCVLLRCTGDRTLVTAALFLVRGAASGVFQAAYVYTPEVRWGRLSISTPETSFLSCMDCKIGLVWPWHPGCSCK